MPCMLSRYTNPPDALNYLREMSLREMVSLSGPLHFQPVSARD